MEKHAAELLLQRMLGNTTATFREGQWEAIDAVVNQRRKLLVDDIVDSAWTLTVLTALLRQAGCPTVYPLALASTSVKN